MFCGKVTEQFVFLHPASKAYPFGYGQSFQAKVVRSWRQKEKKKKRNSARDEVISTRDDIRAQLLSVIALS